MALESVCGFSVHKHKLRESRDDLMLSEQLASCLNINSVKQHFELPPGLDPVKFMSTYRDETSDSDVKIHFAHGTTTLGIVYQGGIVIAVDSRATAGGYIPWTDIKKVIELGPDKLGTMAGGAADNQFWLRLIRNEDRVYELRNKRRMTVAAASKLLSNLLCQYRQYDLVMASLITGFDKRGANLYYVDSDGMRLKHHYFSVGSGSSYAYGVLDTGYRHDMTYEEACGLAKRAIYAATLRDFGTGGAVTMYHVVEAGWTKLGTYDVLDLHYEYQEKTK